MASMPDMPDLSFVQRTPAAMLPICLGMIGLGMLWRASALHLAAPGWVGEALLSLAILFFAVIGGLYARTVIVYPTRLGRDLRRPAGRGAVPAGSEAVIMTGAAIAPSAPSLALTIWGAGVFLHLHLAVSLAREFGTMTPEEREPTGYLVIPLTGLVVAPIGGTQLDLFLISALLFWVSLMLYLVLLPAVILRLVAKPTVGRLRPGAFALIAPPAGGAISAELLYPDGPLTPWLFALACMLLAGCLLRLRWMTETGFSGTWSSFTFPATALAGACVIMAGREESFAWNQLAGFSVLAATGVVFAVARGVVARWRNRRIITV